MRIPQFAVAAAVMAMLAMLPSARVGTAQAPSGTAPPATNVRDTAEALEQQGELVPAEAAWREVLKMHPVDAEADAHIGFLEARQEHFKEAIGFYRKAMALKPEMPGLRMNLGLSEFKAGEFHEAIATFAPLLKSAPAGSPDALRLATLIGLAHYGRGDYSEAIPFLKQATAADASNLPFRLALAHSCLWTKQYQCVLDVYKEIVTLNAESAEADMLAGEALDEMKDKTGAAEQFRAAVKADPKMPDVHFGLGYLLWGLMKFDEAATEFQAEIANNPAHAQALAYLADCDIQLGHADAARPLLEKAVRIDAKIELAHIDLGVLASDAGQREEALREFKTAERLDPSDQNAHWRLARLYQSEGKKAEAKLEFDKTKSLQKAADKSVFDQLHAAQAKGPGDSAAAPTQ